MHSYSIDTSVRRGTQVGLTVLAMSLPTFVEQARNLFGASPPLGLPVTFGAAYSLLFLLMNHCVWKRLPAGVSIPNLNGVWDARGVSSFEDPETGENLTYEMTVIIRQTFSSLEVFTKTGESTSRSIMASLSLQHAMPIFRYAYENTPMNLANPELQRHPGMIELRLESPDHMVGDYFSGKHRLSFGEITMERRRDGRSR